MHSCGYYEEDRRLRKKRIFDERLKKAKHLRERIEMFIIDLNKDILLSDSQKNEIKNTLSGEK